MKLETKKKYYAKLYKWAYKKYRDTHLSMFYNDIKCPGCNEWMCISGINHKHSSIEPQPEWGSHIHCGQCGTDTYWNLCIAPFAVRCNSKGIPFPDK